MSDHKSLIKHSGNYLFANLATKALGFVSIPVYTRLLTVEEYGVVGVFMSIIGVASILFSLNSEVAISRYYYDAVDIEDFKRFVGSTLSLSFIVIGITATTFLLMIPFIADTLSFPKAFTFCILPVSLYKLTNSIFTQIYTPLLQSKKIAIVSSVQVYLAFGLSVLCILALSSERFYGYVYGNILAMFLLGIYMYRQIKPYCIFSVNKKHYRYILNYCLPYLPYTLSAVVLHQFSRIFIGNDQGYSLAGSYTLTTNIASLMMIIIGITHSAWNPYYFRYMKDNDKYSIDNDYRLIWRVTLLIAFGLSAFGYELALLLSKGEDYLKTMYVLPILVLGYVFNQWAYVYLRNTSYAKRVIWNAYCVLASGILNLLLNVFLVPCYREKGAAIATATSFFFLFLLGYLINRYIIKEYTPRLSVFVQPFAIAIPLFILLFCIQIGGFPLYFMILLKILLCFILCIVYFREYKEKFVAFFMKIRK